jgi:hypothetical protein
MATELLKSNGIVDLDSTPIVLNPVGAGVAGRLLSNNDHVACTTGVTAPSLYRLVRVPTAARVKQVLLTNAALGGSTAADLSIGFSDSTVDGTQLSFLALASPIIQITGPADNKLFGSAVSLVNAQHQQDQTFAGVFTTDHQKLPLWLVLVNLGCTQFSADPGGYFDFILKTTQTVTTGGDLSLEVRYIYGE